MWIIYLILIVLQYKITLFISVVVSSTLQSQYTLPVTFRDFKIFCLMPDQLLTIWQRVIRTNIKMNVSI